MARTPTPVTIPTRDDDEHAGKATLSPLTCRLTGGTVWLVRPDARAATYFGVSARADQVIGGIVRSGSRWAVVAYTDRKHLTDSPGSGPVYYLPNSGNRSVAVRSLLRWWWYVGRVESSGGDVSDLDPHTLSKSDQRALFA